MMKYFTLDGWIRDQDLRSFDLDPVEQAVEGYRRHLESIRPRLPADLRRLLDEYCLHDARLRDFQVDGAAATAALRFDAGNRTMQEGRDVSLHYSGVVLIHSIADPEKGLPGPHGYGDVGNDELEILEDGTLEHRFLFSSGIQLLVRFHAFRLEEHGRADDPS